ncbi:MAG: bifunctional nuclease family protein [Chloroflexi bacterium]|nr:bifunctional nuclease family protein [Chloroflexota bacterium]MDA1173607.1 bifunctional nuclease family protein [Chloroflexota bacterium]
MAEMVIDSIRVSLMNYQRVVILKERDSDRYLPIWIGSSEADAIAVKLQDVTVPRPLTHDLLGAVIAELGAMVDHVVVSDLSNDTFYAKLVMKVTDGPQREVDCRPSDAIALAVRGGQLVNTPGGDERWFASVQEAQKFLDELGLDKDDKRYEIRSKVPIYVEEGVIEKAGITMDGDTSTPISDRLRPSSASPSNAPKPVTDEEIEKLSAFSEFLADLPGLEDLGGSPGSGS